MVRKIKVNKNKISFEEEFEGMYEKKITIAAEFNFHINLLKSA